MNFDIKTYLTNKGINYKLSGKNVIKGAFAISCLFHSDKSTHLNLFKDGGAYCFHCGKIKNGIFKVIQEIEKCGWYDAKRISEIYQNEVYDEIPEEQEEQILNDIVLPSKFSNKFPKQYQNYLTGRRFDWHFLRSKYGIMTSGNFGDFKFRIIAPIFEGHKMVSYIGRDITNKQKLKYKLPTDDKVVVPRRELLYNLDNVPGDTVALFEGITNVWRFGDGGIAMMSVAFSPAQIVKLKNKGIKKFFIGFDKKTERQVDKLESQLGWADEVKVIELPNYADDIAELNDDDVKYLRREIFS